MRRDFVVYELGRSGEGRGENNKVTVGDRVYPILGSTGL